MANAAIRIYDALKPALGEGKAKEFIEALDESLVEKIENMKSDLATKGDIEALRVATKEDVEALRGDFAAHRESTRDEFAKVRVEIAAVKSELKDEIATLRLATRDNTTAVKCELKNEIDAVKNIVNALSADFKEFKSEMKAYIDNSRVYVRAEIFRTAAIIGLAQIMAIDTITKTV